MKYRIGALILLAVGVLLSFGIYLSQYPSHGVLSNFPFRLGLDLAGGTELVYTADTSKLAAADIPSSMSALQDVIERRVNAFGVSEPIVQVQKSGVLGGGDNQLLVDLPGVTDVSKAIQQIGETPVLEFKLATITASSTTQVSSSSANDLTAGLSFTDTGLTGRYLSRADVVFDPNTGAPTISLQFTNDGATLFSNITKNNIGKPLAIFLDGSIISMPTIQGEIDGGKAEITGTFTTQAAETLVQDLNLGALPIPITLSSTESVGPSLGSAALHAGIYAGIVGFIVLAIFLILWYRLPGFVAVVALALYVVLSLAVFKLIPVTFTAAGIAGFVLSVGMAVDANILIFERTKEELKKGSHIKEALHEGFHRAWLSIRDSNISSIITACVLFWLGTSSVKGFALTLGIGVAISMFTAVTASRTFLYAIAPKNDSRLARFIFSNGLHVK